MPPLRLAACGLLLSLLIRPAAAADVPQFELHVRPILKAYCLDCHGGGEELQGKLDLRLKRFLVRGGEGGPAIVPGDPANSVLLQRLKSGEMPPTEKKVPAEQIAIIEAWIAAGAPTNRDEPEQLPPGIDITPQERAYWAFQPIQRPSVPTFQKATQPIDGFVAAKLQAHGLSFSNEADRRTMIRRATADLTGLLPQQAELDDFVADSSPDAYERLLDRLLASPHYGERWGRHWLDVAGYAESDGDGTTDTIRPFAWHYRDYVVRALNADKPHDQFLLEQLAGDELVPQPWANLPPEQIDTLAATGFLRTVIDPTQGTPDEQLGANQVVADVIKVVGSSIYGLSIGCAQCHDHRYDPIPQSDYYRIRAILEPALSTAQWRRPSQRLISLYTDADRAKVAEVNVEVQKLNEAYAEKSKKFVAEALEKALLEFPEDQRGILRLAFQTPHSMRDEEQKQLVAKNPKLEINAGVLYQFNKQAADELKADLEAVNKKAAERPFEDFIPVLNEVAGQIPATHLFHRGDHRQPKQAVSPGDLTIAAAEGQRFEIADPAAGSAISGRRSAWAKHLTNGQHPLVGRVLANRLWYHHFGRGIVDTPGEFGVLGVKPTHPELLDWLASELRRRGWSWKQFHRQIMTAAVYRQSSTPHVDQVARITELDAQNALYARFPLQRLDAESLRDRLLVLADRLDNRLYGPSLDVEDDFVGQVVVKNDVPRRSVYVQVRRSKPLSMLTTFDAPQMMLNCERRVLSTGAPQSLMLMNNEFVLKQSELLASRLRFETPTGFAAELTSPLAAKYPRNYEAWQYGYGSFDEAAKKTGSFTHLPHFAEDTWRGGPALPDPKYGWVLLRPDGGHPGESPNFLPIRRWTAPQSGRLAITGTLGHGSENGDGVRGRIVTANTGMVGEWSIKNGKVETNVAAVAVQAGETVDFITDGLASVESDSFQWTVTLTLNDANGAPVDVWSSPAGFHGPLTSSRTLAEQAAFAWRLIYQRLPEADELEAACRFLQQQLSTLATTPDVPDRELTAFANLCQQLLGSNEFLYVD